MRQALLPMALLLLGCGSTDVPEEAAPGKTVVMIFHVHGFDPMLGEPSVEGAEVCLTAGVDLGCQVSDGAGEVLFTEVPVGVELSAHGTKDGFYGGLLVDVSPDRDAVMHVVVLQPGIADAFAAAVAIPWPSPEAGMLGIYFGSQTTGHTVQLSPAAGDGPFYMGDDGFPDLTATSTSTGAFFANLPPGDYEVTFDGCTRFIGWPGATASAARARVQANTVTGLSAQCDDP